MDVAHQADCLEALEVAVDGGGVAAADLTGELLRSPRSVRGEERFEEEASGRGDPQAPLADGGDRLVEIARGDGGAGWLAVT